MKSFKTFFSAAVAANSLGKLIIPKKNEKKNKQRESSAHTHTHSAIST